MVFHILLILSFSLTFFFLLLALLPAQSAAREVVRVGNRQAACGGEPPLTPVVARLILGRTQLPSNFLLAASGAIDVVSFRLIFVFLRLRF